jgi:hypothetical protein
MSAERIDQNLVNVNFPWGESIGPEEFAGSVPLLIPFPLQLLALFGGSEISPATGLRIP